MKTIFSHKRMRASEDYKVWVSRHFRYSEFGVRGRYDAVNRMGAYINTPLPGIGFFAHEMDSSAYRAFVKEQKKKIEPRGFLQRRKEPSFNREIKRVEKALNDESLPADHKLILSTYLNMLILAQEQELCQRLIRGVKDRMGHCRNEKASALLSVLTHYKSRVASLMRDARNTQINIKNTVQPDTLEAWGKVVEAFEDVLTMRRIWHVKESAKSDPVCTPTFFDLGIYDYIQSPFDTPIMRDSDGNNYYLYPQGILVANDNVNFDFVPMKEIEFQARGTDFTTLSPAYTSGSGKKKSRDKDNSLHSLSERNMMVGQLYCQRLNLTFYTNHLSPVVRFVEAFNAFKKHQIPLSFNILSSSGGGGIRSPKKPKNEVRKDMKQLREAFLQTDNKQ